ncbi:acyl-CoA dehydrogenase family protein [Roseibacterium sp. SDUM158017]|uniref:acyl-CoA dehydrogenase family protein n=1 Tax=Roseicyclus salinarum TaxID=3036773 RepID=UPI002415580A|nr:acyl-CoA dehydrogenase family protein [Roseibacterium sp. SDUM158017]MDG4647735.1 acyl-CoA dehydrogenase family protein [Roseibacterium sp. SDUM158017]
MNFEMTDDRRMLAETLRRYLADSYGFAHRTKVAYEAPFHDPAAWTGLAELGVLYAFVAEDAGGMGGGGFDVAVVFEELGRALCPEPVLPALMALRLLTLAGVAVDGVLLGGVRYAVAIGETDAPYDLDEIASEAVEEDGLWTVSGRKTVVYGAGAADRILVAARARDGLAVFDVEAAAAEITAYGMIDGGPAGEVMLDAAPALRLPLDAGAVAEALDLAALALSAEALGAMEAAFAMLVEYLGTRRQFGQPIGAFQALQHRTVDLQIEIEQARSAVISAAAAADGPERSHRASQAKHLVGRIARQVAEEAIQMHGGIAMTWDYPVSHYAKRLVMIDHQFGDSDHHLERLIARLQEG